MVTSLSNYMNEFHPYLIQRLHKPYPKESKLANLSECLSFGGGLARGGLTKEAWNLLSEIFEFDYMGSAEFEFGAVPKALQSILDHQKNLCAFSIRIPLELVKREMRSFQKTVVKESNKVEQPTNDPTVYVLCQKDIREQVTEFLPKLAKDEYQFRLKEIPRFQDALYPFSKYDQLAVGWLELDSGFFFFTDKKMWKQVCALFGLDINNNQKEAHE